MVDGDGAMGPPAPRHRVPDTVGPAAAESVSSARDLRHPHTISRTFCTMPRVCIPIVPHDRLHTSIR